MKKFTKLSFLLFSFMLIGALGAKAQYQEIVSETTEDLTRAAMDACSFITYTTDGWQSGKTYCDVGKGDFVNMSKAARYIEVTVKNVESFNLTTQCSSTGRNYDVFVNGTLLSNIAHGATGCETELFQTNNTGEITIKIAGNTGSIYPVSIKLNPSTANVETYALTVTAENGTVVATNASGTVISDLTKIAENTEVTLTATPDHGYEFASWTGDATGTTNPATVEMTGDKAVTATFSALTERTVSLTTSGNCTDGVSAVATGHEDGKFYDGDEVTLTATESATCLFVKWSDGVTDATRTVTINGDLTLDAVFEADVTAPSLTSASPSGTLTLAPNATTGTQIVTLTFDEDVNVADASLILVNGVAADSPVATDNKITFNVAVTAGETYAITLGAGAVKDAAGNTNAAEITATSFSVEVCEMLTMETLPYTWDKESLPCWVTGPVSYNDDYKGSDNSCAGTKVIRINSGGGKADFNLPSCGTFSVTVSATGGRTFNLLVNGVQKETTGNVTKNECKKLSFDVNSCDPVVVTIENVGSGGATISAIDITESKCYTLTVNDCENGTITASPESETGYYLNGTEITLTAKADNGYEFGSWTDHAVAAEPLAFAATAETEATTTITMDGDKTVGATFVPAGTTSIDGSTASKAIVSVKLYSVTGIEVDEDATGVVIVKTTYEDGSVETTKKFVK